MNPAFVFARFVRALAPASAVLALFASALLPLARGAAGGVPAEPDRKPPFSAIRVLGDSLSDTGRTSAVLTQLLGEPFPPPPYAAGRMSNGSIWIEYLAPMVRRAYNPLDNFSWAGANTGTINVFGPPLPGMLDELAELLSLSPGGLDPKALYIVFGGANDFFRILGNTAPPEVVIAEGVTNLATIVATLHAAGAKNIVVLDLPDIGRTPRALAGGPAAAAGATFLSATFNQLLNQALDAMPFQVVRVSTFELINNMVAHPHKYGFSNVTSMGLLNLAQADTHLFWDDVHPSTRAHSFVADAVFHALARAGMLGQQVK